MHTSFRKKNVKSKMFLLKKFRCLLKRGYNAFIVFWVKLLKLYFQKLFILELTRTFHQVYFLGKCLFLIIFYVFYLKFFMLCTFANMSN